MNGRYCEKEYPEHLNPFRTRKNSFKESIRGLRNTLVRSFRGSDKKRPEIRKREDVATANPTANTTQSRHTLSVIPRVHINETPLLPRSRFSERVAKKTNSLERVKTDCEGKNPFNEDAIKKREADGKDVSPIEPLEVSPQTLDLPPLPATRKKLRKKKKKAPVPPNTNGETKDLTALSDLHDSKWSLVSTETDYSSSICPSDNEIDHDGPEIIGTEEILQITEEIKKLTQNTNENFVASSNGIDKEGDEIRLVDDKTVEISAKQATTNDEAEQSHTKQTTSDDEEPKKEESVVLDVQDDSDSRTKQNVGLETNFADIADVNGISEEVDLALHLNSEKKTSEISDTVIEPRIDEQTAVMNKTLLDDNQDTFVGEVEVCRINEEKVLDDHNNNVQTESEYNNTDLLANTSEQKNFKSVSRNEIMLVAASSERINQDLSHNEKKWIFITGSTERLEDLDETSVVEKRVEYFENTSPTSRSRTSVTKVRQSVLSKENMLG